MARGAFPAAVIREHYYHPEFHGSFSMKKVLPPLMPSLTYDGLEVADGTAASRAYLEVITTDDTSRKEQLRGALRIYCGRDSLAMLEVRRTLLGRAGQRTAARAKVRPSATRRRRPQCS